MVIHGAWDSDFPFLAGKMGFTALGVGFRNWIGGFKNGNGISPLLCLCVLYVRQIPNVSSQGDRDL